jgi:hypothetical protein
MSEIIWRRTLIVAQITISYKGIPEQNILAEEAAGTNRRRLNLGGMFLWLKVGHCLACSKKETPFYCTYRYVCVNFFDSLQIVAEGKVSLGRIHVAASDPLHMKVEAADDFKSFGNHVQRKQQEMVFVSNYHLQATSKLLKVEPSATKNCMTSLGCKF